MTSLGWRAAVARLVAATLLGSLLALLSGCSVVKLGYRGAGTFTLHWLDRYLELDNKQQTWASERIDAFYAWHRVTQLPEYAQWLTRRTALLKQDPVTAADLLALNADITTWLDIAATKALPDLAALALQLKPAQIAAIETKFAKNNAVFRKDFLDVDLDQRQVARYKTVMWLAELLFGRFSAEQQALIRRASDARPLINESWLSERVDRQRDLIATLRGIAADKPTSEATQDVLKPHVQRATGIGYIPDPVVRAQADAAAAQAAALSAMIVNMTTPEQKRHAIERLQQWAADLMDLSR